MKLIDHYATCPGWVTGGITDCTCYEIADWRIRKETDQSYPWRIWRRTGDFVYEPVMRCSTWHGAVELVNQFIWLRQNALHKESNV